MIISTHTENLTIHHESNHPLNFLKRLPKMTNERLSKLSCNEDQFLRSSGKYQNMLKDSGFKDKLIYTTYNQRNRGQHNRKVIWYNPLLISRLKQTFQKLFFNYWTEIFHHIIDYIRLST